MQPPKIYTLEMNKVEALILLDTLDAIIMHSGAEEALLGALVDLRERIVAQTGEKRKLVR